MPRDKRESKVPEDGLNIVELSPGAGSVSIALKDLGIPIKFQGVVEHDSKKTRMYGKIHDKRVEPTSISEYRLPEDRQIDILSFGSPRQEFSGLGRQESVSDVWQTARMVGEVPYERRPKTIMFENGDGILGRLSKPSFTRFKEQMDALGYDTLTMPLRGKDFGGVDTESRVFTLLAKRDEGIEFDFHKLKKDTSKTYDDILEPHESVHDKFFIKPSSNFIERTDKKGLGITDNESVVKDGIVRVDDGLLRPDKSRYDKFGQKRNARFLTPKENFRKKGISDEYFDKISLQKDISLEELVGDSLNVDTLKAVFTELFKLGDR